MSESPKADDLVDNLESCSLDGTAIAGLRLWAVKETLERVFDGLSTRLNNVLCEMKPGYDDSIEGFNEAWDVMQKYMKDQIARAALQPDGEKAAGNAPFVCPRCGTRGTTDGESSTVASSPPTQAEKASQIERVRERAAHEQPHAESKPAYIKRWRTIVQLPAAYADAIVDALRFEDAATLERRRDVTLETLIRQYANDLRRNASGGDDYPYEAARATADYLETLIERSGAQSPPKSDGKCDLAALWKAVVDHTKGDGFWVGEILLDTIHRETGYHPGGLVHHTRSVSRDEQA